MKKTYKEFYTTLSKDIPEGCLRNAMNIWGSLVKLITNDISTNKEPFIKEMKEFLTLTSKLFYFNYYGNSNFEEKKFRDIINATSNFLVNIVFNNNIRNVVRKSEYFPLAPVTLQHTEFLRLFFNTGFSYGAMSTMKKTLIQKQQSMEIMKLPKYSIKRTLKALDLSLCFLSRLSAVREERIEVISDDVKIANDFLRIIFFRIDKQTIEILKLLFYIRELDIFLKFNNIQLRNSDYIKRELLKKYIIFKQGSACKRIVEDSVRFASRMLCVRKNVKACTEEEYKEGFIYILSLLGIDLNNQDIYNIKLNFEQRQKIKKLIDKICVLYSQSIPHLDSYFINIKSWFFDYIATIDKDSAPIYGLLINETNNFIKLLTLITSLNKKKDKADVEDVKNAVVRFFKFFINT
ncbi:MAG: hypothetical protein ACP6IS_05680 [Candidatus Asgardarchaeia archaeon]